MKYDTCITNANKKAFHPPGTKGCSVLPPRFSIAAGMYAENKKMVDLRGFEPLTSSMP